MFPTFTINESGPCIAFGGAEIPLPDLIRMEGVACTPSANGCSEVLLKCTYGSGRTKALRVHVPRATEELHQTTSMHTGNRPVTRISEALIPVLSREEFEHRLRAMQKGERNERL